MAYGKFKDLAKKANQIKFYEIKLLKLQVIQNIWISEKISFNGIQLYSYT